MNKKKVAGVAGDAWACGFYRIIQPFNELSSREYNDVEFSEFVPEKGQFYVDELTKRLEGYDCVVFQRPGHSSFVSLINNLKNRGVKVVVEIDDNLMAVSRTSPAITVWGKDKPYLNNFLKCLELADAVSVSTPELTEIYKDYNDNFGVFLNALIPSEPKWDSANSLRGNLPQDKTVVGWAGSSTHLDSLQTILPHFREVFQRRSNSIFALCSNKEFLDMFKIRANQKHYIPHVPIEQYHAIPSHFDIGICPVVVNEFNAGKSELKVLENAIWGIPSICTDIAPYRRFHEISGGANLLVENNSPRQWKDAIHSLIDDESLRKELGKRAYDTLVNHYSLEKINNKRVEWYRQLVS